jgi:hypothetical protein
VTSPSVELHFNPTDLRPRDLPAPGAFLTSPAEALEAALAMVRARMVSQMKAEARGLVEPTYGQLLRLADMTWQILLPQYRKVSAPVIADAYVRAWTRAGAGDVPMSVIYDLAEKHAEKVGDYFHASSRDALAEGFNTMVNRRIPAKAAADKVLDAYGLTPRQMRGYAHNQQLTTSVESPASFDVKARSRDYIDKSFTGRVKKLSEQEEHNIEEQAKQFAWMWMQDKGRLTERAQKIWITAHDERVCPVCGPLHGQKVLVNEQFKTKEGDFWSPGVHPNCRCVVRLIENRFKLEKRFDPHQPRGGDGRWAGGQSRTRQLGHKVNALESPSAKVIQGTIVHRSAQAVGYVKEPRYLITPLKHRDKEMARLAHGAAAWSRKSAHVQRARKMEDPDNEYYAGKMKLSQTEKSLKALIKAVDSAPANAPALYRGMTVTTEHLDELKQGSTFTLPISSFTEDRSFSEHFARKWGPMIARAHAKREGRTDTSAHPLVMMLEPKANALNISPLVSERQAEWITRGEFQITQVGEDNGLTVVHLKQTSHRISKADWDAKEHPRGGDPENPGRFSRVTTKERPRADIWRQLAAMEEPEEPMVESETPEPKEINITGGLINIAPRPRPKRQISIAQEEINIAPAEISIAQPTISLVPEQQINLTGAPSEINLTGPSTAINVEPAVQPEGKPDLAPYGPVQLHPDGRSYYAVVHLSDYDTDMYLDQKLFVDSRDQVGMAVTEARRAKEDEILDAVLGSHHNGSVRVQSVDEDGEPMYAVVSSQSFEAALHRFATSTQQSETWNDIDLDNYEDVIWTDSMGHRVSEDFSYVNDQDVLEQAGVHPDEFNYRVLEVQHGHRDENMVRTAGPHMFKLSGQYVETGPTTDYIEDEGREIPVVPMRPYE